MGQKFILEDAGNQGQKPSEASKVPSTPAELTARSQARKNALFGYREELKVMRHDLTELDNVPTSEIMMRLSSMAARLREIHAELWDMGSTEANNLRSRHVDPLIKDLDFHFRCHSRRISDLQLDWDMSRGQ